MKKKPFALILAVFTLLLSCIAPAMADDKLIEFLGIPFGETPRETALEILSQYGDFEINQNGYVLSVPFAGHAFDVSIQNSGKHLGGVVLYPSGASDGAPKGEAYNRVVDENIQLFIELDQKLATVYGEPDARFFRTSDATGNKIYMFASGEWEHDAMLEMYRDFGKFIAYSQWNNVVLQNMTRGEEDERPGGCSSTVHVQYYDYTVSRTGAASIPVYPPVEE